MKREVSQSDLGTSKLEVIVITVNLFVFYFSWPLKQ